MKKRIQFIIDELLKENFITVKEDLNVRQNLVIQ